MLGTKIFILSSIAVALTAATPDYFPLQVGNSWLYKGGQSIEVTGTETINEQTYYTVTIFGRSVLVRSSADGVLVTYNRETATEEPWLMFTQPEKQTYRSAFHNCNK